MNMKFSNIFLLLCLFAGLTLHCTTRPPAEGLYVDRDFSAENLFSGNIEGPAFDSKGNLYVVNYLRDGTIGKVNSDGSCELFV